MLDTICLLQTPIAVLIIALIFTINLHLQGEVLSQNDTSLVTSTPAGNQSNISSLTITLTNVSNQTAAALTNATNMTDLTVTNLTDIIRTQIDLAYSRDWPIK